MATEQNVALRRAVKYLVDNHADRGGNLTRLAEALGISRQRVHQIAAEMRKEKLAKLPRTVRVVKGGIREKVTA